MFCISVVVGPSRFMNVWKQPHNCLEVYCVQLPFKQLGGRRAGMAMDGPALTLFAQASAVWFCRARQTLITSFQKPGLTSCVTRLEMRFRHSSGAVAENELSAAAVIAGARLKPALQKTSVGSCNFNKFATMSIAETSIHGSLPAPSTRGKRQ